MTITTKAHVGSDGIVTIRVPDEMKDTDVEVTLSPAPKNGDDPWAGVPRDANGWPTGFFEATAGSFADEPLERAPQGEFETREEFD